MTEDMQENLLYEIRELRKDIKALHVEFARIDKDLSGVKNKMKLSMAVLGIAGGTVPPSAYYIIEKLFGN